MYYYGLFICDSNLHPVSRFEVVKIVRNMANLYCEIGWPCKAYVLGRGDSLHDPALDFGAPVNAVLVSEHYATDTYLHDNMARQKDVLVFILPQYDNGKDPLWNPELGRRLMNTDVLAAFLAGAYEVTAPHPALTD